MYSNFTSILAISKNLSLSLVLTKVIIAFSPVRLAARAIDLVKKRSLS